MLLILYLFSGVPTLEARYVDNGNGTVTDISTGLMWQQVPARGPMTWTDAMDYCRHLTLADHMDWRLPTLDELKSLIDSDRYFPAIDGNYFPETEAYVYWSASTLPWSEVVWVVSFFSGVVGNGQKSYHYYVRAVRTENTP